MLKRKILLAICLSAFICMMPSFSLAAEDTPGAKMPAAIEMEWQRLHDTWQNLPKRQKDQLYKAREAVDNATVILLTKP